MPKVFCAFDSKSENASDSIQEAATEIALERLADFTLWTDLKASGILVLNQILSEIDSSDIVLADCTTLNPNVLFELGYAVAKNKHVSVTLDLSSTYTDHAFKEFGLLSQVRYVNSMNSSALIEDLRHLTIHAQEIPTLFSQLVAPHNRRDGEERLLYLKPFLNDNPSIRVQRQLQSLGDLVRVDDPKEATQTLSWYADEVFNAFAVVCHLLSPHKQDAAKTNARYSFVAGLAYGLGRELLIIADREYEVPFDYLELLRKYENAQKAEEIVKEWTNPMCSVQQEIRAQRKASEARNRYTDQLRSIYLGQVVAEHEAEQLAESYFVKTGFYEDAIHGRASIFIGRRGTGKSATLIKVKHEVEKDPRAFVCVIKPEAYELKGVLRVTSEFGGFDREHFALQSLWKYLLLTELAVQLGQSYEKTPIYLQTAPQKALTEWLRENERLVQGDFATRLEEAVAELNKESVSGKTTYDWRQSLSERLHTKSIRDLNALLHGALKERSQVYVVVDNLDKAWEAGPEVEQLSEFLLALLNISADISRLFDRRIVSDVDINFHLCLFLRSDIFHRIKKIGREHDKIPYRKVEWLDPEMLVRVVEERFKQATGGKHDGKDLWPLFFEEGTGARDKILGTVYRRPRDLISCVSSAITTAADRNQPKVRSQDLQAAFVDYSAFVIRSVSEESSVTGFDMDEIITNFIGCKPVIFDGEVFDRLAAAGIERERRQEARRELCLVGFLGIQTGDKRVEWIEDVEEFEPALRRATTFTTRNRRKLAFIVRTAFWPYLEVDLTGFRH